MVPTDYSLILYTPGEDPYPFGGDAGQPPGHQQHLRRMKRRTWEPAPTRSAGTDGQNWRVVAVTVLDNGRSAVVVIGLPLQSVDDVLKHATLVVTAWAC